LNEGGQSATGALLEHILDWHAEGRHLGGNRHERVVARVEELLAAEGPALVRDLHVLPDFHGNRSPLADPLALGAIQGLTLDSSFDSLARLYYATAIGIALGNRHIVEVMNRAGYAIDHLQLTGGHAANPTLVQLYADAADCVVVLPSEADGVLLGTSVVASVAAGLHPSIEAAGRAMVRPGAEVRPEPARRAFFDQRYRAFRLLLAQSAALRAVE
jgi:ribulose kinase